MFLIRDFLFTRLRYSADLLYLYFVLLLMCKDLNLFCRRSISSPATVTVFVKEYFQSFALLSFCSKNFLYIFIEHIALTTASNPPIIPYGVSLKLHSVAKSIMPLRMGSRVRIPHRNATVMSICSKSGLSLVRRAQTLELRVHGISQFGCTPLGTSFFYPRK